MVAMEHQQRSISTYPALLDPHCRRRLPATPDLHPVRRSSSPRMLPTPPPLHSPDLRCPSPHLERRPSGRLLPKPPTEVTQRCSSFRSHNTSPASSPRSPRMSSISPASSSPLNGSPRMMTPSLQYNGACYGAYASICAEPITPPFTKDVPDPIGLTVPIQYGAAQTYDEVEEYEPDVGEHELEVVENEIHELEVEYPVIDCRSRTTETPDEGVQSQCSSISPSMEQLTSKSSSDAGSVAEDPMAHGLDPSLYVPGAPICISAPTDHLGRRQSAVVTPTSGRPSPVPGSGPGSTSGSIARPSASPAVPCSSSFNGSEPRPTGLGLITCTLQHFPVRKRLRVSILKIEGLAGQLKPDMEIHALCRVSIPGMKTGKEQSSEVKRGRDPVFNQEFFFDNVMLEDLDTRSIHVKAYHCGGLKQQILIGECTIPLKEIRELNTKKEVKVIEELKAQVNAKKLGKIYISSCIEKDARRLTINLKKADDLPRWGFLGAPDVCVKITVDQGANAKTKCSRVLKSTTTAVYNEAVMFLFNPAKSELAQTKITISVHDMQRSCTGDDVIGCAYLGILAQDKSEVEQWKNTVEHMGKEYKGAHHLKLPQPSPEVHVADADPDADY